MAIADFVIEGCLQALKERPYEEIKYNKGETLKLLDEKHKYYGELSRFLAKTHGFDGLKNIHHNHLLNNVDLLYFALDKDGANGLYHYIMFDLKNNSDSSKDTSSKNLQLRNAFLKDEKIRTCLSDEFYVTNKMVDVLDYDI